MDKQLKEFLISEITNEASCFDNLHLCNRASTLLISYYSHCAKSPKFNKFLEMYGFPNMENFTPIEQIFYIAYIIYSEEFCDYDNEATNILFKDMLIEELVPQCKVLYGDKGYVIDFAIDLSRRDIYDTYFVYPKLKKLKFAIELDGYEYHSNKMQMQQDYERENNLKEMGYSVIRFTGSQVYNSPFECVEKLINIIINAIEGELK